MLVPRSTRLTPEQCSTTEGYLRSLADKFQSPVYGAQLLFGRCCLAALQADETTWGPLTAAADKLALDIAGHPNPASLNLDPVPLIEIYMILKAKGHDISRLRQILVFAAAELEAQSTEIRSAGRLRLIARSLTKIDIDCRTAGPDKAAANLMKDQEAWLTTSAKNLLDVTDHLLASDVKLGDIASTLLSLIALGELRNYRVDVACKLLRTVLELGEPGEEVRDAIDFMALQRRRDGRYGFLDRLAERPTQVDDDDLALFLPMTLNAVWLFKLEADLMASLQGFSLREALV